MPVSPLVATVDVHAAAGPILDDWRRLAAGAGVSPYQHPDWLLPWADTIGREAGVMPRFATARDRHGAVTAVLPLGLTRRQGLIRADVLGLRDANFKMGLFAEPEAWTLGEVTALLRAISAASTPRIDYFAFEGQPDAWSGRPNPLAACPRQPSPSFAYATALRRDPEAFFRERLSRDGRKKLRQKWSRLAALGPTEAFRARDPGAVEGVLDALVAQRRARLEALGLPVRGLEALRRFLERASDLRSEASAVELYGLRCGDRIIATFAGTRKDDRFSGMLMSYDASPDVARASPGELLLAEVIRSLCAEGLQTFDLGVGEARYKDIYCPDVEPLFDCLVPVSLRGRVACAGERLRLRAKRSIKQSTWAWPLARQLRKALARSGGATSPSLVNED